MAVSQARLINPGQPVWGCISIGWRSLNEEVTGLTYKADGINAALVSMEASLSNQTPGNLSKVAFPELLEKNVTVLQHIFKIIFRLGGTLLNNHISSVEVRYSQSCETFSTPILSDTCHPLDNHLARGPSTSDYLSSFDHLPARTSAYKSIGLPNLAWNPFNFHNFYN